MSWLRFFFIRGFGKPKLVISVPGFLLAGPPGHEVVGQKLREGSLNWEWDLRQQVSQAWTLHFLHWTGSIRISWQIEQKRSY